MPLKPETERAKRTADAINSKLAAVVRQYRAKRGKTKKECAYHIGKSLPTYNLIESGSSMLLAGELEMLRLFLQIPRDKLWPPAAPADQNERWAWVVDRELTEGILHIKVDVDLEELPKPEDKNRPTI